MLKIFFVIFLNYKTNLSKTVSDHWISVIYPQYYTWN